MEPSKRGRGRAKKIESRVSNPKTGSRNADTNENKSGRGRGRGDVRKTQKRQNDTPKSESHNEEDDSSGSEMEEEWNHDGIEDYDFTEEAEPITDDTMAALAKVHGVNGVCNLKLFGQQFKRSDGSVVPYPRKWTKPCIVCRMKFDDIPVFPPKTWNEKSKIPWTIDNFATCCLLCAVEYISTRRKSITAQRLGLLSRFAREFFGFDYRNVTRVAIECVEGFCDNPIMTWEEYRQIKCCGRVTVLIKEPICAFVETWAEGISSAATEEQRRKDLDRLLHSRPTQEQEATYRSTMFRVVQEHQRSVSLEHQDT